MAQKAESLSATPLGSRASDASPSLRRRTRYATDTGVWARDSDLQEIASKRSGTKPSRVRTLILAWSSLGVIYGDIGTSPLYTLASVFPTAESVTEERALGAFSTIFWTIAVIVLFKYVSVALSMDDHGEGGAFALYSLICRACGIDASPERDVHASDVGLKSYLLPAWERRISRAFAEKCRGALAGSRAARRALLAVALLAVSLILSDGVLTPAVSVVSAVQGVQFQSGISNGAVTGISIAILLILFAAQHFGTTTISRLFSPIITIWFFAIGAIGLYNIARLDASVFRALSPHYLAHYWKGGSYAAWRGLSNILLAITGAEALFADLGHFNAGAIRISFTTVVFPCLTFCYLGQVAVIIDDPSTSSSIFWASTPRSVYWPMVVVATMAAIIASQALITGSFSIVQQAVALNCFPRVTIRHTSSEIRGQVFCPETNIALALTCVGVVAGFGTGPQISAAYGLGIATTFLLTTTLLSLAAIVAFDVNPLVVAPLTLGFWLIEGAIFSSALLKVPDGAWFTLGASVLVLLVLVTWTWGQRLKGAAERRLRVPFTAIVEPVPPAGAGAGSSVGAGASQAPLAEGRIGGASASAPPPAAPAASSLDRPGLVPLRSATSKLPLARAPGVGVYYGDALEGVPPVLRTLLGELPALHEVVVLLTVRRVPIPSVGVDERFLVRREAVPNVFRVIARYGYIDAVEHGSAFADALLDEVAAYLTPEVGREAARGAAGQAALPDLSLPDTGLRVLTSAVSNGDDARLPGAAGAGSPRTLGDGNELTIGSAAGASRARLAAAARAIAAAARRAEEGAGATARGAGAAAELLGHGPPNASALSEAADGETGNVAPGRDGDEHPGHDAWVQQPSLLRDGLRRLSRPAIPSFAPDPDADERALLAVARARGAARVVGRTTLRASRERSAASRAVASALVERAYGVLASLAQSRIAAYGLPERGVLELGITYRV